jgi:effector-binding domain-containing protein
MTNDYAVSVQRVAPRAIACVRARVQVSRIPAEFGMYLNQVYAAARAGHIAIDGQNIFSYRGTGDPAVLDAEFGVGAKTPFADVGNVVYSQLPGGEVATTTHWGDYSKLGAAHTAVTEWCRANNRRKEGTSWEIYGHMGPDPTKTRTDVYYLLKSE